VIGASGPRVSVVIPAYNEGENIVAPLARLVEACSCPTGGGQ